MNQLDLNPSAISQSIEKVRKIMREWPEQIPHVPEPRAIIVLPSADGRLEAHHVAESLAREAVEKHYRERNLY